MRTAFQQGIPGSFQLPTAHSNIFTRLLIWSGSQQEQRLFWLAIGLVGHGCILTPLTFLTVVLSGINFFLLVPAMLAMASVLVVNLAALPTKITIPVLLASFVTDIIILSVCLASGFNI